MPRSIGEPYSNPKIRDLKVRIPTIDELMRPPQAPPWWQLLPPPAPSKKDGRFGPIPIIPPLPPPPIEVDPPSRPPEWFFGPPYISSAPTQPLSFGPVHAQSVRPDNSTVPGNLAEKIAGLKGGLLIAAQNLSPSSPSGPGVPPVSVSTQQKPGGILGMLAEAGLIDPSIPDRPPPGGLLGLIQEHLRNNKNGVGGG
jgi:hypothetical protein